MATVTGMTAARMQAIEDESIVNGVVTAGHLILSRHNGTTIDSGSVIGPPGPTGPTGATSIAIVTSGTRPTGGALFTGLMIYETDTKRIYVYDGATWIYRGGLWLCTSVTRPASPFSGLMIFETDTKLIYIYDGAAWTYRGGTIICTSGTRPSNPVVGLPIYETDTNKYLIWNGFRFDPPWNMPWGIMAVVKNSASQTGIGTLDVDLTGLVSPALTYVANRWIRVSGRVPLINNSNATAFYLKIKEGAGLVQSNYITATTLADVLTVEDVFSPTAGSHTYKLAATSLVGTCDRQNTLGLLVIEDMGPNGAPA